MIGLTKRQAEVLAVIRRSFAEHGIAPTYQELAAALGTKSRGAIHRLISGMIDRGHLRRAYGKTRSVELVALTEPTVPVQPTDVPEAGREAWADLRAALDRSGRVSSDQAGLWAWRIVRQEMGDTSHG